MLTPAIAAMEQGSIVSLANSHDTKSGCLWSAATRAYSSLYIEICFWELQPAHWEADNKDVRTTWSSCVVCVNNCQLNESRQIFFCWHLRRRYIVRSWFGEWWKKSACRPAHFFRIRSNISNLGSRYYLCCIIYSELARSVQKFLNRIVAFLSFQSLGL